MSRVAVLGSGGHSKVVIDILLELGHEVVACVSTQEGDNGYRNIPVIVGDEALVGLKDSIDGVIIAIGSNLVRVKLAALADSLKIPVLSAISPRAHISPTAVLGRGTVVMAGVVINSDVAVGELVIINTSASVDHDCVIGDASHIGPGCNLAGNVRVGPRTFLGVGTKVIPQINIGNDTMVGAGSLVIRDIASNATYYGVPAQPHKKSIGTN